MPPLDPSIQLTLLWGDAPFLLERAASDLVDAILPGPTRALGLTVADLRQRKRAARIGVDRIGEAVIGSDSSGLSPVAEVLGLLRTGSLMAPTQVFLLQHADAVPAAEQNQIAQSVADLLPGVHVIITAAASRQEAQKGPPVSAKLRKVVEERGQSAIFMAGFEREIAEWAVGEAARLGKRLDRAAAEQLVALVGRDHALLFQELRKLSCYVGDAPAITARDIAEAASRSAEASSFELVDAIAEGNAPRALAQLSDLVPAHSAQAAAIPLLGMIARQLRLMWQAAYLASCGAPVDRGGKVAAGVTDLLPEQQNVLAAARSSFMARKLARQARNFGDQEIAFALERVLQADRALKGQTAEQLDPRLVMERLVTELCLLARRAARTGTR